MTEPRRRTMLDVASTYVVFGVTKLRGLAIAIWLTAALDLAALGRYTLGMTAGLMATTLATLGTGTALVVQWPSLSDADRPYVVRRLMRRSIGIASVTSVLWMAVVLIGAFRTNDPVTDTVLILLGFTAPARAASGITANIYRSMGRVQAFSALNVAIAVAEIAGVAIGLFRGSLLLVSIAVLISVSAVALMSSFLATRAVPRGSGTGDGSAPGIALSVRQIFRSGYSISITGLVQNVLDRADRFIVSSILGPRSLGAYSLAYGIVSLMYAAVTPLTSALLPTLRDQWKEDRAHLLRKYSLVCGAFLGLSAIGGLAIVLLGPALVSRLIEPTADAHLVANVLSPLTVGAFAFSAALLLFLPYLLDGREQEYGVLFGAASVPSVCLSVWLTHRWGLNGTALAAATGYAAFLALLLVRLRHGSQRRSVGINT